MSQRIVIVSAVYPYPRDNGKRVVLAGLVDYFRHRYGADSLRYLWLTKNSIGDDSSQLRTLTLSTPSKLRQGFNAALALSGVSRKSIQESVLYSPVLARELESTLESLKPDLVVADTFRIGQMMVNSRYRPRTVMYMDDLFSLRYERMLAVRESGYKAGFNALGNFGSVVPKAWANFAGHPKIEAALLRFEKKRTQAREVQVADRFPLNLLINQDEAREFQSRLNAGRVDTIKPLMNVDSAQLNRNPSQAQPQFVLLGDLRIAHNRHATLIFLEQMVDVLRELIPGIRIRVVGRGMDDLLAAVIARHSDIVEYLGFVKDLDRLLSETTALLVPLQFGTGVKIKTLEALARGIPVVSTGYGVEGIPGAELACIVEDDISEFPNQMKRLVDPGMNEEYSERAFQFYQSEYSQTRVYTEYDALFEPWLASR